MGHRNIHAPGNCEKTGRGIREQDEHADDPLDLPTLAMILGRGGPAALLCCGCQGDWCDGAKPGLGSLPEARYHAFHTTIRAFCGKVLVAYSPRTSR